ncbi:MAG TPA: alpha/beta fold hydrolase, partial [Kofleriaceae bacterium]|nr:alpha/beta fold hydrolase [Kofleriaceae bacterium]
MSVDADDASSRDQPPRRFDDYEVLRPLGAGGMGTVYLGHDRMLDRPVALKFIAGAEPDPRARERFLDEARAIARLHHPNVVGIYRIGVTEGRPYLAYELVDGEPLHRLARPMPWRRVLELGLGIARGLAAVHEAGVLHRDVKPSNVVVARGDVAKLIDFGLARRHDDAPAAVRALAPTPAPAPAGRLAAPLGDVSTEDARTSIGGLAGTPMYMAPELWTGAPPSPRSDVYALGLVLWELLTGELPFAALSSAELAVAALTRTVPPIASQRADLPAPLAALIDGCLARDPAARVASAAEARDRLETIRAVYAPLIGSADDGGHDADAVAASFGRAAADADRFSQRFYDEVFAIDPRLRALFPSDMRELRSKLVSTLQTVVRNARAPELVVPLLEDLGWRHHRYGVQHGHFDVVGRALLATLAAHDRDAWGPALEALWTRAYQHIAEHMGRGLERAALGTGARLPTPPLSRRFVAAPEPRFARAGDAGDVMLAYQLVGDAPVDLVVLPDWVSHLELAWQDDGYAELMSRLARRHRVVIHDRRGTGLSDRVTHGLGLDDRLADLLAVLDAAGVERAAVLACGDAAPTAIALAASHPERVRGLVFVGATACLASRPGFTGALADGEVDRLGDELRARWGEPLLLDRMAPSRADDERFRTWWARLARSSATPATLLAHLRASAAIDARAALPAVRTPTLVVHRKGDRWIPASAGAGLAALVPGARRVELDGDDHLPFVGDREALVGEVE